MVGVAAREVEILLMVGGLYVDGGVDFSIPQVEIYIKECRVGSGGEVGEGEGGVIA
jgi:hypothetical protein